MNHLELFHSALKANNPTEKFRQVVIELRSQGIEKNFILSEIEHFRNHISAEDEISEDIVLEVMDFLVGYCSPHMRID